MNIVAVRCLMETVTPQLGVEYAQNFGITTLTDTDYNPATALGGLTKGVTNLELTAAYASIANGGVYTKPIFFTKILDRNGKELITMEPETHRVLKDSTAFLLTDAMAESMISNRKFSRSAPAPPPPAPGPSFPTCPAPERAVPPPATMTSGSWDLPPTTPQACGEDAT